MNPHKRGDLSPCGTKRFWAYGAKRSEGWVFAERYNALRERDLYLRRMIPGGPEVLEEERKNTRNYKTSTHTNK